MTATSDRARASGGVEVLSDRVPGLRRTLRALPSPMLTALARGLDANRDRLISGHLFRTRNGGGCAVGVMLLELDPATYRRGVLRFWLRDRWRRRARSYGGELARNPRLRHLEWIFDESVKRLRTLAIPGPDATQMVGSWMLAEAVAELERRVIPGGRAAALAGDSVLQGRPPVRVMT